MKLSPSPSTMPLDLELPKIRVPSSSSVTAVVDDKASSGDAGATQIPSDDSECRTPTSSEHRIQAAASCPPAPRKPRAVPSRKRRREFFDTANREEVEGFFRSCELALCLRDRPRGGVVRRRYLSKGVVVAIL
ncbi:cyclin-dependent protein kinase inhibitor SMR1-like [Syzygium oleosum]|uniref:cyclin-dependent protein kinase inhibitor SMR1-like n=1 Tax=Syzygium oleosum TaxID=219896 RepID=UPI0011D2A2EF|nr:cyclin-dependent protein kinase inhibitor SMR1-like [Syzygium oleosum]